MAIKNVVGNTVRRLRLERGLSQEKLSALADVSLRYFQYIEAGARRPSIPTIFKLANALEIPYAELLEEAWDYWVENPDAEE